MSSTNFKLVFRVDFFHSYYQDDHFRGLNFKASGGTNQLMSRYNFKIIVTATGFDFYANTQQSLKDFLNYINQATEVDHFHFTVTTIDTVFYSFTDLPIDWNGQIQYESNSIMNDNELKGTMGDDVTTEGFASLKIYFDDIVAATGENNIGPKYKVVFNARKTQWRYYVINRSNINLENVKVVDQNSEIKFEAIGESTIPNGEKALMFSSGNTFLPLSEVSKYKFDLVLPKGDRILSKQIIFSGLPSPNASNLMVDKVNNENIVISPMYVYA
ncbi:hypothetical protein [Winogradskyella sp. 3972H.M.0a.05]|uniref:hypothetical protein n=1 Tax=Winogradskyella sp. 3972H.M.0a.05 TaxID=2950277 RepID=UPI003392983A